MWKKLKTAFYFLYLPAIILTLIVVLVSYYLNIPFGHFTRDPLAVAKGNQFLGIISNIGVILWSFAAAVCFFTYALLKTSKKVYDTFGIIFFGGFISLALLLDDFFMLHERVYPRYFGISEKIVLLFYGVLILFYLVKFRKIIIQSDFIFILLALFFFGFSILVDIRLKYFLPFYHFFEDVPKFFGIVSWFSYQFSVCFQEVKTFAATRCPDESIIKNI